MGSISITRSGADTAAAKMQLLRSSTVLLGVIPTIFAFPSDSEGVEGLLVPDLGISGINDVNIENVGTILDLMIKSGGSVKNVIDKFSNLSNLEMVEQLVEESEDIITRLQQGVSEINEKHRSYAGEALKDMIYIKLQLKTSRISLNDLAQRTVFAVDDLKAFSEAFFADDTEAISKTSNVVDVRNADKIEYVKEQMTVMVNLVKDTNTKITEVRTIYAEIRERMSAVEEKLVQYKLVVEHLLKNESSDGANYQVYAGSGVYTSAGISTTACIVADILGAMGFCSLINAAAVTGSTITLEVAHHHHHHHDHDHHHHHYHHYHHHHHHHHHPGGGPRQHARQPRDPQEGRRAGDLRCSGVDGDPGRGGGVPVQRGADSCLLGGCSPTR